MSIMAPNVVDPWTHLTMSGGYPTPTESLYNSRPIDSPLEGDPIAAQAHSVSPELSRNAAPASAGKPRRQSRGPRVAQRKGQTMEPDKRSQSAGPGSKAGLRFVVVSNPDQLHDPQELRKNRMHVMNNYLANERQNPDTKDVRASGAAQTNRGRSQPPSKNRVSRHPSVQSIQSGAGPDTSWLTPASSSREGSQDQSDHDEIPRDQQRNAQHSRPKAARIASNTRVKGRVRNTLATSSDGQALVKGIGGSFQNSDYMRLGIGDVPVFSDAFGNPNPDGLSALNPFDTWPSFDDPTVNVSKLKWLCSQRFGSQKLSLHWIPTLLRARHAFLSTLCISSAHDDIMNRALGPAFRGTTLESQERTKVRLGTVSLINQSMNDPRMQAADETIIAVLHLLSSEIMGCNDSIMTIHQKGLHQMVLKRGGLGQLGVSGQLAAVLTM